jgi:hypothetical protein
LTVFRYAIRIRASMSLGTIVKVTANPASPIPRRQSRVANPASPIPPIGSSAAGFFFRKVKPVPHPADFFPGMGGGAFRAAASCNHTVGTRDRMAGSRCRTAARSDRTADAPDHTADAPDHTASPGHHTAGLSSHTAATPDRAAGSASHTRKPFCHAGKSFHRAAESFHRPVFRRNHAKTAKNRTF